MTDLLLFTDLNFQEFWLIFVFTGSHVENYGEPFGQHSVSE